MNVLVVAADGLNCRWLGPYGNEWVSTPALDALATEAIVFDRHFADRPSPAGSRISCPIQTFQALRSAGITVAFVDDRKSAGAESPPADHAIRTEPARHPTPADALVAAVQLALNRVSASERWLLWVETDRLIPPWDLEFETYQQYAAATAGFTTDHDDPDDGPIDEPVAGPLGPNDDALRRRLQGSFAAAVTSFDEEMGVIRARFRDRGLDDTAAWIITSGHGWPLGEHGVVGPTGSRMHAELVHLPLVVRLPGGRERLRRVPAFTQSSDLPATLFDLFQVPLPPGLPTTSLLPLANGSTAALREDARSSNADETAIRTADWAYLPPAGDRPPRLYRRPDDIWEVNDLAPRHPDECDRLGALLAVKPTEVP
jgi:arylsulfatase A-like enzyme